MATPEAQATIPWTIKGKEFVNCNCAYGCPCQFQALPTQGHCRAAAAYRIERGRFGAVSLDGLCAAAFYAWPGPVHEGNGSMQLVIDERADASQRDALLRILNGEETNAMATVWWVYSAMCPDKLEPLFLPIEFEVDVQARRAHLVVPGIVEAVGRPIRNRVTGAEHRVRIELPAGFEYRVAEVGSGTTSATAGIGLEMRDTYGQFAEIHLSNHGVVG